MVDDNKTASLEILASINEALSKDQESQESLRAMFTNKPASLREQKEGQEMRVSHVTKSDGVMVDISTRRPISKELGETILKSVDERMLTEANPLMREMGFRYVNNTIIRESIE